MDLAHACGACVVGFNVKSPPGPISQEATRAGVKVINKLLLRLNHIVFYDL